MARNDKYFGVHIPSQMSESSENPNRSLVFTSPEEVNRAMKGIKDARFKSFTTREEAEVFSHNGSDSGPGNPVVSEGSGYRSVKSSEIAEFRKYIETEDLRAIQVKMWENPRYLVGIGDAPTILREGPRYNALHISAIHNSAAVANLILHTISSDFFNKHLYGGSGENTYVIRPEVMVDRYLNTPDKIMNETPLHFASKFGSLDVIKILIMYPQLQWEVKNKDGKTAKDIVGSRITNKSDKEIDEIKREIRKLLEEPYFVPFWKANDDVIQPIIGKPFSPKNLPVCPLPPSPLSPTMGIKAFAGPMSYDEADQFHKRWKSPTKIAAGDGSVLESPVKSETPRINKGLPNNHRNCDRSIEKIGRILARVCRVTWKEYWPFLDKYVDLTRNDGLQELENYLQDVIMTNQKEKEHAQLPDVINDLCNEFSIMSLNSPFKCVERLCSDAASAILRSIKNNFEQGAPIEDNLTILLKRIRRLMFSMSTCSKDNVFYDFPFDKVHANIAEAITTSISTTKEGWLRYITSIFNLVNCSEGIDLTRILVSPSSSMVEFTDVAIAVKCISQQVTEYLSKEIIVGTDGAIKLKNNNFSLPSCSCFDRNNNGDGKVPIDLSKESELGNYVTSPIVNLKKIRKNLFGNVVHKNNTIKVEAGNVPKVKNNEEFRWNAVQEDSDDEFFTPLSSPYDSEDEMESPDEGPGLFIYDNRPTSMDNEVFEIIAPIKIDHIKYPSIYRWKHNVSLYSNLKRLNWPVPNYTSRK